MAIPKYDELYLPVLKALSDGESHATRNIADAVAQRVGVTEEERKQKLSSGVFVYYSRVTWALAYLKNATLIEKTGRGKYRLTEEGNRLLLHPPAVLDNRFLRRFPSFQAFMSRRRNDGVGDGGHTPEPSIESGETPSDRIEQAYAELNEKLSEDLLSEIMEKSPDFFEELVVKLLMKMGYGGADSDSGRRTQRTNDGGIDGVIREDKLGFDQIYIQAKRWDPEFSVSRPEIQKFMGALQEVKASKGLFITTAKFTDGARSSAERQRIVLVDGKRLTKLMIEYDVGVSTVREYKIKSIDSDFFDGEQD